MTKLSTISALIASAALAAACSSSKNDGNGADAASGSDAAGSGSDLAVPMQGFQVRSPDITIPAGKEITYCWYFHTPNTTEVGVKSWQSRMTTGSHHMIMFFTGSAQQPDNTLDPTGNCGGIGGGQPSTANIPTWVYSAQTEDNQANMPSDDGTGSPVGMTVPANQAAYFQLHYLNATDNDMVVHATLNANTFDTATTYTKAAAYVTYQYSINVPAAGSDGTPGTATATGTCDVSPTNTTGIAGVQPKFFTMSTHSHHFSLEDQVMDGSSMLVDTTDWNHPEVKTWDPTFYQFASGKLTYTCSYSNSTSAAVTQGQSAQTNEMCMAVGYFFPATQPKICVSLGTQGSQVF